MVVNCPRQSNPPRNRTCKIAWEWEHVCLLYLQALQMQLEYIVNEPSVIKNMGELTKIQHNLPKNRKCEISPERECAFLLSLWALQTTLEHIVNDPSTMVDGEKLTEIA